LLNAAEKLLQSKSLQEITVADIGRLARVSPSLINAYFGGRAGLFLAVTQRQSTPQVEAAARIAASDLPAREKLVALITVQATADLAQPSVTAALYGHSWVWPAETEATRAAQRAEARRRFADVLATGAAAAVWRIGDPELAAQAVLAAYAEALRYAIVMSDGPDDCVAATMAQVDAVLGVP